MATLTVQEISRTGITPTYTGADVAGDEFLNDGRLTFVQFKNTNDATRTVTFVTQQTVDGLAVADRAVTIPATSGDKMVGPFPILVYNDTDQLVQMTYNAVTNLSVAVFKLPTA